MSSTALSDRNRRHLEVEYTFNSNPDSKTKSALAELTGLTVNEVHGWFQDRGVEGPRPTLAPVGSSALSAKVNGALEERSREPEAGRLTWKAPLSLESSRDSALTVCSGYSATAVSTSTGDSISILDNPSRKPSEDVFKAPDRTSNDEGNNYGIPGTAVFSISDNKEPHTQPRRKRKFFPERRKEVALVRRIGACIECKRRKVRCRHVLENIQSANNEDNLPYEAVGEGCIKEPLPASSSVIDDRTAHKPVESPKATFTEIEMPQSNMDSQPPSRSAHTTSGIEIQLRSLKEQDKRHLAKITESTTQDTDPRQATRNTASDQESHPKLVEEQNKMRLSLTRPATEPLNVSSQQPLESSIKSPGSVQDKGRITTTNLPMQDKAQLDQNSTREAVEACQCGFAPTGDPKWRKSNLARHIRIMHNDMKKKYTCQYPHCGKVYRRSDNLRVHERNTHWGEKLPRAYDRGKNLPVPDLPSLETVLQSRTGIEILADLADSHKAMNRKLDPSGRQETRTQQDSTMSGADAV